MAKVKFTPFAFTDLLALQVQPAHSYLTNVLLGRIIPLKSYMEGPHSWSAWTAYGRMVACCGILPDGRAWALLSNDLKREMVPVTRKVREVLEAHPGPLSADIDGAAPEAVRWAKLLGFELSPKDGAWRFRKPAGASVSAQIP